MSPKRTTSEPTSTTARTKTRSTPRSAKAVKTAAKAATDAEVAAQAKPGKAAPATPKKPGTRKRPTSKPAKKPTARKRPAAAPGAKIFVLDTNVLLHDPTALHRFEENDLVIPITVLEEVDHFKKGTDTLHFHAREIARELDDLLRQIGGNGDGTALGRDLGRLFIHAPRRLNDKVRQAFMDETPDHRILSAAIDVQEKYPDRDVALVSKDVSLRLKARSLGVPAEDYENDKVPDLDKLYKGRFELRDLAPELIDAFYAPPFEVPVAEFDLDTPPFPNAYFVLKSAQKSALARFDADRGALIRVEKRSGYGIMPRNSEQTFALDAVLNDDVKLVTLSGKAGTGKTLIALAGALQSRSRYEQIYLARPVVPLGQQEIGYLPGDLEEKLDPFMQPLWDNLNVIRGQYKHTDKKVQAIDDMLKNRKLQISALAYIRGRSLNRIHFIVDEAQNLTGHEVKTIITRAGEGTKIILTGDPNQIDSPYLDSRSNGLTRLIDRMKGQKLYAHVTLEKGERSELSDLASSLL